MILTCPSCATRYFVKDDAVPSAGRTVRCASCGGEWRATGEAADATPALMSDAAPGETAEPGKRMPALPFAFRAKVTGQRQTRAAVAQGVVWAGLTVAFAGVALAAVLFRTDVVRAFPRANAAYAAVRMPVNPTGLALEGVQGGPGLQDGRQVLAVTGALRNVETAGRRPAALRVSIFDQAGHRAASQVMIPGGGEIRPGESRPFRAVFFDPPLNAAEFGVDFAWDAAPPARAKSASATTAHPAAAAHTPMPAPVATPHGPVTEAKALPADSPYALAATAPAAPAHGEAHAVAHGPAPAH